MRTFISLFILLCALTQIQAQNQPIRSQFQCLGWQPISEPVYILKGQEKQWIKIPHRGLSRTYSYEGPTPLTFYREGVDENGQPIHQPVGSVPIDSKRSILLLSETSGTLRINRISDQQNFQPANVSVYNLSGDNLAFALGESRFVLKPNDRRFADMTEDLKAGDNAVPQLEASIAAPGTEGEWDLIYRKRWPLSTDSSILVFAINQNDRVKVQLVRNKDVR